MVRVRALFGLTMACMLAASVVLAKGRREVAVTVAGDPDRAATVFATWKRFDFVPAGSTPNGPSARTIPLADREQQALLHLTIGQAFAQRGYRHETAGPVDFVIETTLDHPGDPPPGSKTWIFGKKTNWLEIRLRPAGDRSVLWTGRAFHVLRKKRDGKGDEDLALRFLAAAQTIARSFPRSLPHAPAATEADTRSAPVEPDD